MSDISSPSTPTFGSEKLWLLVMEDNTTFAWSYLLKEKSVSENVMTFLIKDLKAKYGINEKHARFNNAGENEDLEMVCKQEGWVFSLNTPCPVHHHKMEE